MIIIKDEYCFNITNKNQNIMALVTFVYVLYANMDQL